jgi:predicted phosphodiesterase
MKIQILSDTHFECIPPGEAEEFARGLLSTEPSDCLVLAGDICSSARLRATLDIFCKLYTNPIYFVCGNHEYWNSTPAEVRARISRIDAPHFHWLNMCATNEFIGGTLWFPDSSEARLMRNRWPDFHRIDTDAETPDWIFRQNKLMVEYLLQADLTGKILVTHHLPSKQSIAPPFQEADTNCFFLTDIEAIICDKKPALVIHGHTHCNLDYYIEETHVVCNPHGYPEENPEFIPGLIVEV